jgi:hypothetical protein
LDWHELEEAQTKFLNFLKENDFRRYKALHGWYNKLDAQA